MKTSIQQIRSQCANDLRKRDVDMQKLRSHMAERQRGKREGLGVTTITVTPPPKNPVSRRAAEGGEAIDTPGYSLKQETTEFLTQLCQNLSDENDSLIAISKRSVQTLRSLQGLPDASEPATDGPDCSINGTSDDGNSFRNDTSFPQTQCEALSREMEFVLEQLRTLLTNPSFVPLEEVELRDNEISRLREGWEEMEIRWREAVNMMDGWHKRISSGGASINIDELNKGMGLGQSFDWKRNSPNYRGKLNSEECAGNGNEDEPIHARTSTDHDSMEISISKPTESVNHADARGEGPSAQSASARSRRIRGSSEAAQSNSRENDEDEKVVLVDNPDLLNVQQRRTRRRANSKVSKLVSTHSKKKSHTRHNILTAER